MDTYTLDTEATPAYAVHLRLTPELKHMLADANAAGEHVSLRFRQDDAVLCIGGQEFFFSLAPQPGRYDVLQLDDEQDADEQRRAGAAGVSASDEDAPRGPRRARVLATVRQRLNLQRTLNAQVKSKLRASGEEAARSKQRSAVLLDGGGVVNGSKGPTKVTSLKPPPAGSSIAAAAVAGKSHLQQGQQPRASPPVVTRPGGGAGAPAPPSGPPRKALDPPKPKSMQPGSTKPPIRRPTPPPQGQPTTAASPSPGGSAGDGPAVACAPAGAAAGAAAPGPAAAAQQAPKPVVVEIPKAAVLAAKRGDLVLVIAALLGSGKALGRQVLQSRVDMVYKQAGKKAEAPEYIKRVVDNSCVLSNNRLCLKPEVQAREAPRLEELTAAAAHSPPTTADTGGSGDKPGGGSKPRKRPVSYSPENDGFDSLSADAPSAPAAKKPKQATGKQPKQASASLKELAMTAPTVPKPPVRRSLGASGVASWEDDDDGNEIIGPGRPLVQVLKGGPLGARPYAAPQTMAAQQQPGGAGAAATGGDNSGGDSDSDAEQRLPPPRPPSGGKGLFMLSAVRHVSPAVSPAASPLHSPAHSDEHHARSHSRSPDLGHHEDDDDVDMGHAGVRGMMAATAAVANGAPPDARPLSQPGRLLPAVQSEVLVANTSVLDVSDDQVDQDEEDSQLALYGRVTPEVLDSDVDVEMYRPYIGFEPPHRSPVRDEAQYRRYEQEYRSQYEVYFRLNQKVNEVLRQAEAYAASAEDPSAHEDVRRRWREELWRHGARKWRLLKVWQDVRNTLHKDLAAIHRVVQQYVNSYNGGQ